MWCNVPPSVKHAIVFINYTKKSKYVLPEKAEYTCKERFKLEGNKTITCMNNGEWSTPPQCSVNDNFLTTSHTSEIEAKSLNGVKFLAESKGKSKSTVSLLVVVMILVTLVMIIIIVVVRYKIKLKSARKLDLKAQEVLPNTVLNHSECSIENLLLKRKRLYDAIIFYHFDTDDDFVLSHLLPELEETRNFKLCIHSRDFTPGRDIKDNIEESINKSNSAIIVMSQGFVDSI